MISSNHGDKIMITVGRSPVETRQKVPLTEEDVKKLAAEIQPVLEPYVRQEMERLAALHQKKAECDQNLANAQRKMEAAQQKIDSAQQKIDSAQQKIASGQQKIVSGQQKMAEAELERKRLISRVFYRIFNQKANLTDDQADQIFAKYLINFDKAFETVRKDNPQDSYIKINSMKPVINYLTQHKEVITCDFRNFPEIHDVKALVEFLSIPSSIIALAFKNLISADSKLILMDFAKKKEGTLGIKFY